MGSQAAPRWARRRALNGARVALWHVVRPGFPGDDRDLAACTWRADVPPWERGTALEWRERFPEGARFVCDYCAGYADGWCLGTLDAEQGADEGGH
jgi:hypothetical protein